MVALDRMRELTLEVILRVVFGAADEERGDAAARRHRIGAWHGPVAAADPGDGARDAGLRADAARGAASGWRSSASTRCCSSWWRSGAAEPRGDSVLDILLEQRDEQGNAPSDRHLRDELVALLVGGHDSSAASLAWAFERLARHPAVHARLREGDPAYLDAVVKEVMRVRPALTIAPRLLLAPVRIGGHDLPAGVQVAACLWLAMRREDLWPHAAAFRPERWLDGPPPNQPSWIPFGGGVRRCAGAPFAEMEMREVLRVAAALRSGRRGPKPERSRRSMLVVIPDRGAEIIVG